MMMMISPFKQPVVLAVLLVFVALSRPLEAWAMMMPGRSSIPNHFFVRQSLVAKLMLSGQDSWDEDDEYSDFADYSSSSSMDNDFQVDDHDSTRDEEDDGENDDSSKTRTSITSTTSSNIEETETPKPQLSPPLPPQQQQVRASIAGVSVERHTGFWVMLRLPNDEYWPLQVTDHVTDRMAATSGQALTLVQLLSRVDMAGVMLPPQILAQLLIVSLENNNLEDETETAAVNNPEQRSLLRSIHQQIQSLLNGNNNNSPLPLRIRSEENEEEEDEDEFSYTDANMWIRSRVKLPLCTLDQVHLDLSHGGGDTTTTTTTTPVGINFDVVVRNSPQISSSSSTTNTAATASHPHHYRWTLNLKEAATAPVLLQDFRPLVSRHFLAVALSLRYKAPIRVTLPPPVSSSATTNPDVNKVVVAAKFPCTLETLLQEFPLYRSVDKLQQSSDRVFRTIERGFEIHQLQAAFTIARQKQDFAAMAKIQAKIDELDRAALSQIPVQPESDMDAMQ